METLLQEVCTFDKYHKLFQLLTVGINITSLPGKSTCSPLHWEQGDPRARINIYCKENIPAHIRNQSQFSLSHTHTHTTPHTTTQFQKYNTGKIEQIIHTFQELYLSWESAASVKMHNETSNGGFCGCRSFQTNMMISSQRHLKISSYFLCFIQKIYGDIHFAQIFCIPHCVSSFLTHLPRPLEVILCHCYLPECCNVLS
jgi:hypothetical protein